MTQIIRSWSLVIADSRSNWLRGRAELHQLTHTHTPEQPHLDEMLDNNIGDVKKRACVGGADLRKTVRMKKEATRCAPPKTFSSMIDKITPSLSCPVVCVIAVCLRSVFGCQILCRWAHRKPWRPSGPTCRSSMKTGNQGWVGSHGPAFPTHTYNTCTHTWKREKWNEVNHRLDLGHMVSLALIRPHCFQRCPESCFIDFGSSLSGCCQFCEAEWCW